jgi:hypothetical protein
MEFYPLLPGKENQSPKVRFPSLHEFGDAWFTKEAVSSQERYFYLKHVIIFLGNQSRGLQGLSQNAFKTRKGLDS